MIKKFLIALALLFTSYFLSSQKFAYGYTFSWDLYQLAKNPDDGIASPYAGNAILNFGFGPKIWIGGRDMTFSLEALAGLGITSFSVKDYKGMGTAYFPVLAKLNFNGLSTMDKEGQLGWSIGGGLQHFRTELYGLSDKFEGKGVKRSFQRLYVVQAGYGFGLSGFGLQGFLQYGWNKDNANIYSLGMLFDFNVNQLKKITTKESSL